MYYPAIQNTKTVVTFCMIKFTASTRSSVDQATIIRTHYTGRLYNHIYSCSRGVYMCTHTSLIASSLKSCELLRLGNKVLVDTLKRLRVDIYFKQQQPTGIIIIIGKSLTKSPHRRTGVHHFKFNWCGI